MKLQFRKVIAELLNQEIHYIFVKRFFAYIGLFMHFVWFCFRIDNRVPLSWHLAYPLSNQRLAINIQNLNGNGSFCANEATPQTVSQTDCYLLSYITLDSTQYTLHFIYFTNLLPEINMFFFCFLIFFRSKTNFSNVNVKMVSGEEHVKTYAQVAIVPHVIITVFATRPLDCVLAISIGEGMSLAANVQRAGTEQIVLWFFKKLIILLLHLDWEPSLRQMGLHTDFWEMVNITFCHHQLYLLKFK